MRAGDRVGDLRQRRIGLAVIFKAVLRRLDRMCPAAPFPHQPRSRSEVRTIIGLYASVRLQHLGQCQKFPPRRLAEAAMGQFLEAIGDAADQEVTAQPWRLAAI